MPHCVSKTDGVSDVSRHLPSMTPHLIDVAPADVERGLKIGIGFVSNQLVSI